MVVWAMAARGTVAAVPGMAGPLSAGVGSALELLVLALMGAGFGAVFRHQPNAYAATISSGLLYGLLWWIAGPLTVEPLLGGRGPGWSLAEASGAFPALIGYLLYGGLTGLTFYALVTWYLRTRPELAAPAAVAMAPTKRVVILGGGFGGVSAALRLEQLLLREANVEVTLVSQSNYLLFTPMLPEVASGALEAQHISAPLRACFTRTRVHHSEVEAIDPNLQIVRVRTGPSAPAELIAYDQLVLALGAVPNYFGLSGLERHSFSLKSLADAIRLRNHVISMLERADAESDEGERRRQLTFVVAGGGFAGTETIAELFDLVHSVLRYYPSVPRAELRFVLVHGGERILPELSGELGEYALRKLQARGIEFVLGTLVAGATPEGVLLADEAQIPTRTLVWTAGNQPNPLLRALACEHNRAGAVVVENTLQVVGLTNVWAVGDCAQIPDGYNEGRPYPPTAQHAMREGIAVAENLVATLRGKPLRPFRYRTAGVLVALGHRAAVAELRRWKFSGLLAWFIWRMVYLSRLPGLEKKLRVGLDWTIELFFPRDIVLTANQTAGSSAPAETAEERQVARTQVVRSP